MSDVHMPSLQTLSSSSSQEAQASYTRSVRVELTCLTAAAVAGAVPSSLGTVNGLSWNYGIGAAFFAAALVLRLLGRRRGYRDLWFADRASAESTKTLAWRYAVRAVPFDGADDQAISQYLTRVHTYAPSATEADIVTPSMRQLRSKDLEERRQTYTVERIQDQEVWYGTKSAKSAKRDTGFTRSAGLLQAAGIAGGVIATFALISFDALGIMAAAAASIEAWTQMRQDKNLAISYSIAAGELSVARQNLEGSQLQLTEEAWARYVDECESAISREHTSWLATRTW